MVLAAGYGVRMRPLTLLRAKPVLPVLNRPLLHWTLDALARAGVDEAVINLHHLPATVRAAVGDGRRHGLRVRYSHEPTILGTGGGPRRARRLLGEGPVLLVNGDIAFDFDLGRLCERHRRSGARATLALRPNPDPRRYGSIVTAPDGRVRALAGLPRRARGTASLFTGIHVLDPALLRRLPPGASDSVRDLYAPLVGDGEPLLGVRVRGAWYDFGNPKAYLAAQLAMLRSGFGGIGRRRALVHPTARVSAGARVTDAVVGAGTIVEDGAAVVRSVLWDGVRVRAGARVSDSVLATGAAAAAGASVAGRVVVGAAALGRRGVREAGAAGGELQGGQVWAELK